MTLTAAEGTKDPRRTRRWTRRVLLTATALLVGLALGYAKLLTTPFSVVVEHGGLAGPDSYTRLLRVEHLLQTGRWYRPILPDLNAPVGIELHWTRLLDALIVPLALGVEALGADERRAILIAGYVISPLLAGMTLLVLCRALLPHTSPAALLLVPVMMFLSPQASFQFMWARPDHHSLLIFLFATSFACVALAIDRPSSRRAAYLAGIASALGLWVSVEALVAQVCLIGILTLLWIIDGDTRLLQLLRRFSAAAFVTSVAALALERPIDSWLEVSYHHISIVHVVFLFFVASGTWALFLFKPHCKSTASARLVCSGIVAATLSLVHIWLFPQFIVPPYDLFDPVVKQLLIDNNAEYQPLFRLRSLLNGSTVANLTSAVLMVLLIILSFHRSSTRTRSLMILLILPTLVYLFLALEGGARWAPYAQVLAIPPTVYFIDRVLREFLSPLAWQLGALLLVVGPTLLAVLIVLLNYAERTSRFGCPWHQSGRLFNETSAVTDPSSIILSDVFAGPEIAWFTGLRVVAGPYGEPSSIDDTQRALVSTGFEPMREVVARRGVDFVLVCALEGALPLGAATDSTYARLQAGRDLPPWLRLLEPANGDSIDLKLYQVVAEKMHPLHPALGRPTEPVEVVEIPSEIATTNHKASIATGGKAR